MGVGPCSLKRVFPGCLARPLCEHHAFIASRAPPAQRSLHLREVFREIVSGARQGLLRDTRLLKCHQGLEMSAID